MAEALDPATGGWSGLLYGGLATLASTAFGINRQIVAKRREEAIKQGKPDRKKIHNDKARAEADKITGESS